MKKHALVVWPVLIALACNNAPAEKKNADTIAATVAADSVIAAGTRAGIADTFMISGRSYFVVPLTPSPFEEEPAEDSREMDQVELMALKQDTAVKRKGDTLLLPVENGEPVAMVNNKSDGDDYAQYHYDSFLPEINCYCLIGSYYEAGDYILLNRSTGANIHVWGKPVISPYKTMLICPSFDIEAGFIPNGFQLFSNRNGKLENMGDVSFDKWGPGRVKWLDNDTVAIEQKWNNLNEAGEFSGGGTGAAKVTIR